MDGHTDNVITGLSALIFNTARSLAMEQAMPTLGADESDEKISGLETRLSVLRELRETFEDEMARQP